MSTRLLVSPLFALALLAPAAAPVTVQDGAAVAEAPRAVAPATTRGEPVIPWPMADSDIPVDERMHFGVLANGMKYAWMSNPEPKERSYLRLHVAVGSTAEEDDEQGLAHFLEHMAFNGSEHYAAGELITWFQERGMDFGAHVNASTSFDETIYKLDLPESDEQSLVEGLVVMGDYAGRLLLEEEEIAKEIGVIDGEERERDSVQFRVGIEALQMQFDGTRIAQRIPIGVREVRAEFDAPLVRGFYERWYRPENMTFVLVGDLGDLDPTALIEEHLGGLEPPEGDPVPVPGMGTPTFDQLSYSLSNEELKTVSLQVARLRPYEEESLTLAEWVDDAPLWMARAMLNLRFSELARKAGTPFLSAGVGGAGAFDVMEGETLSITCDPDKWEAALSLAEQELRRALEHGFQQAELDEVRGDNLLALGEAVEREATRSSGSYLGSLLAAAVGDDVPTTAATNAAVLGPVYEALTVEACHEAFVEAWSEGELALTSMGGLDLGEEGAATLLAAYEASRAVEVEAPEAIVVNAFAYASDADDAGEVVSREHVEDLDITQVRFANGVMLNVKSTDFKDNEVTISARIGEGSLALEGDGAAVRMACLFVGLNAGGTGAHDLDELRRLTAGRQVIIPVIGAQDDHFTMGAGTNPEDALLQMELMAAYLRDPGWRDDSLKQIQAVVPLIFQQLTHDASWPLMNEFMPDFHDGDPRMRMPSAAEMTGVSMEEIAAWAGPQLAEGPLEVSVVGDVDVDQVVEWAARTFGALPDRREARPYDEKRELALVAGLRGEYAVPTEIEGESVQVFYPTTDGRDVHLARRLNMLARVLDDRLRETIREELGEAYSPSASSDTDDVYPGYGMIQVNTSADTGRAADVLEACLRIGDDLAREGVDPEEVSRLREPLLKTLRDGMRQNGTWMFALSRSQSKQDHLDNFRERAEDYESITAEELSELAGKYLKRENASSAIVRQEGSTGS